MSKDYRNDFLGFYQDIYKVEGDWGPKPITPPFLVDFLGLAFRDGKPTARNILDARTKKQGKSSLAGAVALYMAGREPYAEVVIAASDKDQSRDRVLRAAKFACEHGPLAAHAKVYKDSIELDNRSVITALPMDWQGAAGGNYSAVIFDELHGYIYEGQRRLFDELLPPPTQPDAVRWIASYAGFLGESLLLKEWWDRGLDGDRISELPIYYHSAANLLAFIDTGPESWRMPWMTQEYIDQTREAERETTFRRLWLNEWTSAESAFVPEGAWDKCYSPEVRPLAEGDNRRVVLGVDASTTRDLTGLVGSWYNAKTKKIEVIFIRAFEPKRGLLRLGKPTIDLELVKKEIVQLHDKGQLNCVLYDPYQMASIAIELERAGIRMIEHPQTTQRVESDQQLYDAVVGGAIAHYNDPKLNAHIRNAIAIESVRGFRLAKEKTSLHIDLAVALSMSLYGVRKYALHGTLHTYRDFLEFDHENYSYHTIEGVKSAFVISKEAPKVHRPGVTWQTCKWRNRGCPACVDELEAEGFFEDKFDHDSDVILTSVYDQGQRMPVISEAERQGERARTAFMEGINSRMQNG